MTTRYRLSRRELLRGSAGLALAPLAGRAAEAAPKSLRHFLPAQADGPYAPFRMGIQSYSLRGFDLQLALEQTQRLGLRYWESWDGVKHLPQTEDPARLAALKEQFRKAGVEVLAYGVLGFGADAARNRRAFEFARAMGIRTLSSDPEPAAFEQLEGLVDEFGINIAIHNHGPRSRYDQLEDVTNALKGRHRRIGACVDTGHFLRSRVDPVKAIEAIGERVYGVHLKDVKNATAFTVLGEGDLDLVGCLKALRKLRYGHILALEYEENPQNPTADLERCLAAVRAALPRSA